MNQLSLHKTMSASDLAAALSLGHVAICQTRSALVARGLITATDDPHDARRRTLTLSASGRKLVNKLGPLWAALNEAAREIDREAGLVTEGLERLEAALDKKSLVARVRSKIEGQ